MSSVVETDLNQSLTNVVGTAPTIVGTGSTVDRIVSAVVGSSVSIFGDGCVDGLYVIFFYRFMFGMTFIDDTIDRTGDI